MKKNFVKSLSAAIIGLSLTASCSAPKDKEAHKCASNNCSAKKADEAHKCAGKEGKAKKVHAEKAAPAVVAPAAATPKAAKK